jgi:putative FmdB family regulatory protein
MATYDFTCQDCGHTFTDSMGMEDPIPACNECKSKDVLRHFPCPAVHIFYSPCHPRHKRGMVGQKPPKIEPQFRNGVGPNKKKKGKKAK